MPRDTYCNLYKSSVEQIWETLLHVSPYAIVNEWRYI